VEIAESGKELSRSGKFTREVINNLDSKKGLGAFRFDPLLHNRPETVAWLS
jgi:hypothetical protein